MNTKSTKTKSIRYNTLFYLILFSIFILLVLWGTQLLLSNYLYEKYQINDVNKIVKEIENVDNDDLHNLLVNIVYNNSVCIEYVDEFGRSTLYNDTTTGCLLGKKSNIDLTKYKRELLEDDDTNGIKFVNPEYDSSALLYKIEVKDGYVYLFTMLSNINKNAVLVKRQLIYITIIVIILAVIISIYLANIISGPIYKITKKSKSLANGNYDVEFEKNGIKEIDELADTLNYLKNEVSKTDEYRRDLMANVSHDLKTPLTMIKAYAEMVRDISYKDKKKREEHLQVIIDETDRLNVLVGDILALSKLQSNADTMEIENFDLNLEIKEILKRYELLKETEEYKININMPEKIMVCADKNKINQVIYNLINNAINYTGDDNTVLINITEEKKQYLVEIKDSGKGIEKEKLDHIWDKYYKNEKNHKRNVIGTGLGLSIVKNILELHDFTYGVKTELGKGTTFYFKIKKANVKK